MAFKLIILFFLNMAIAKLSTQESDFDWTNRHGRSYSSKIDYNFKCPLENGHFPRPDDCRSFHHCDRNVARIKLCPPLTRYDPRLHMCMFSSFVTCFKDEKYECPADLPIGRYRNAKCDR